MATSPTVTPASTLLDMLDTFHARPIPTDLMAENAMVDFLNDIQALDKRHNKKKIITQDQLAEQVLGRSRVFKDTRGLTSHFRYQLRVATEELVTLNLEIRAQNNGTITFAALSQYGHIIRDYIFDLRAILLFLQRNVAGWTFFDGGKNDGVNSWEVYRLARQLAYQSTYTGTGKMPFDHKAAQIASIFILRQAMELRFERLIAVYPTDPKGKTPRLKHGFHHEFIVMHPQFFQAKGFKIKELGRLYDWCSEVVHRAYQPYAWQISMALRRGGDLLQTQSALNNQSWSIHNAVEIIGVEEMQAAYENHFLSTYGHGTWQMTRKRPEAFIQNWRPDLAFTSKGYLPILNRPNFLRRGRSRIKRFWGKL